MKISILKQIAYCHSTSSQYYWGDADITDMEDLKRVLLQAGMDPGQLRKIDNRKRNAKLMDDEKEFKNTKIHMPSFSLACFDGSIKKDNAQPTSLFGLDFDDGTKMDDIIEYFKDYGFVFYTTSSHTPECDKFRLIIEFDTIINNNDESHLVFQIMNDRLEKQGFTLDGACKDISRRFVCPSLSLNWNPVYDNLVPLCEAHNGPKYPVKDDLEQAKKNAATSAPSYVGLTAAELNKLAKSKPKSRKSTGAEPYFNSLEDQNILNSKKIDEYLSLPKGQHYTKFYGLISHMKKKVNGRGHLLPDEMIMRALGAIDSSDGGYYSYEYREKKLREHNSKHPQNTAI